MEYNEVTEYEWCLMGYYIKRLKRIVETNLKKDLNECMKILEEKEIEKILSKISDGFENNEENDGKALRMIIYYLSQYYYISSYDLTKYANTDAAGMLISLRTIGILDYDKKTMKYKKNVEFEKYIDKIYELIIQFDEAYDLLPTELSDFGKESIENNIYQNADEMISKIEKENKKSDLIFDSNKIKENKELLIKYIQNIVKIDSSVYSLKKRYNSLIEKYKNEEKELIPKRYKICLKINKGMKNSDCEIQKLKSELLELEASKPKRNEIRFSPPPRPIFDIKKPEEPKYKEAIIFNKKKREVENERLKIEYENKLKDYYNKLADYQENLAKYEKLVEVLKEKALNENEIEYESKLKNYEASKKNIESEISQIINIKTNVRNNVVENCDKLLREDINTINKKAIEYELDYIEKKVKELIDSREKMYNINVIYGKYRNMIAMSSFADYLLSNRCEKLEGENGAYNLYEQESRADVIIVKMDQIIDKLDSIEQNQYFLYNELSQINNSLYDISDNLLINNKLLEEQISITNEIKNNTENISYNTTVLNYYNNIIANNTTALTFMKFIGL